MPASTHKTLENSTEAIKYLKSCGVEIPPKHFTERPDAYLHLNGNTVMNAASMYFGGAKTGKTTVLSSALEGSTYIFLDFDRNYSSVIEMIIKKGGSYFNGMHAYNILYQLMEGKISNVVVIIDALNSVIQPLCNKFIKLHQMDENPDKQKEVEMLEVARDQIGINQQATVTFFNLIIEPMTRNNSINFIHHTTQNHNGEKMEGNQGAWLSVFDFTYQMDRDSGKFKLKAGRLKVAPDIIGADNNFTRIEKIYQKHSEKIEFDGQAHNLVKKRYITDKCKNCRDALKVLEEQGKIQFITIGKSQYINLKPHFIQSKSAA